jgi:hypothetical protein
MSTDFYFAKKIRARDFFDGRLEKFGVWEHHAKDTSKAARCLTDGYSYLWVFLERGYVTDATRFYSNGNNGPVGDILLAIAEAFDTDIFTIEGAVILIEEIRSKDDNPFSAYGAQYDLYSPYPYMPECFDCFEIDYPKHG